MPCGGSTPPGRHFLVDRLVSGVEDFHICITFNRSLALGPLYAYMYGLGINMRECAVCNDHFSFGLSFKYCTWSTATGRLSECFVVVFQ